MPSIGRLKEIEKKLKELNIVSEIGKFKKHSENEIIKIENKYGFEFPQDYREFLLKFGNSSFESNSYFHSIERTPYATEDNLDSINVFYGLDNDDNDLAEQVEIYLDRIPKAIIPIAEAEGGNIICIGVKDEINGKIFYWDHENEYKAKLMLGMKLTVDINEYWENVYIVAESFWDFIMSFKVVDKKNNSKIDLDDIELQLDDDLL